MFGSLDLLEELDLLIGSERDDGLLPVATASRVLSLPLQLAAHLHGPHARDLDVEDGLDRLLDLQLVGVARDLEVVLVLRLAQSGALLGDQRLAHDGSRIFHRTKTSFIRSSPRWVTSKASQPSRSCG